MYGGWCQMGVQIFLDRKAGGLEPIYPRRFGTKTLCGNEAHKLRMQAAFSALYVSGASRFSVTCTHESGAFQVPGKRDELYKLADHIEYELKQPDAIIILR